MLPFSFIGGGNYTNPATPVAINVPVSDQPDWIFLRDITVSPGGWGGNAAGSYTANTNISSEWFSTMAQGSYLQTGQAASATAAAALYPTQGTSGGFTFINSSNPPTFATLAGTAINKTTLVVTMGGGTGSIGVGDYVRLISPTAMLELGGLTFQVTAVSVGANITLGYTATAVAAGLNLVANGTTVKVLKFYPGLFYPREKVVAYITQANPAKVYFHSTNDFTPGELVDFTIPTTFGMTQLSYLTGMPGGAARVLTVTNSATESSITINVDTTGFTPFQYPLSAAVAGAPSPPVCYPAGSGIVPLNGNPNVPVSPPGTNLLDAFDNRNQYYVNFGLNVVGSASSTIEWRAFKSDWYNLTNA